MARSRIRIETLGMKNLEHDFMRLTTDEPYEHGRERLNNALRIGFEGTQAAVPVDAGDYRRPAGALRDSGRYRSGMHGDIWNGEVAYGTEDDEMPYAAWVRYRNLRKKGEDYLGDPMEAVTELFDEAVNAPFDDVFRDEA